MDFYKCENIASVTLYDLRVSEGELMVFESCIDYVLKNCLESEIYSLTGCATKVELKSYQDELLNLIKSYSEPHYLPSKYKSQIEK